MTGTIRGVVHCWYGGVFVVAACAGGQGKPAPSTPPATNTPPAPSTSPRPGLERRWHWETQELFGYRLNAIRLEKGGEVHIGGALSHTIQEHQHAVVGVLSASGTPRKLSRLDLTAGELLYPRVALGSENRVGALGMQKAPAGLVAIMFKDEIQAWTDSVPGLDYGGPLLVRDDGVMVLAASAKGDRVGKSAGGYDVVAFAFDASGRALWERQVGSSQDESAAAIGSNSKGEIAIVGSTFTSSAFPASDVFVIVLDPNGSPVTQRVVAVDFVDDATSVHLTDDGAVVVAGHARRDATDAALPDAFVLKLAAGRSTPDWVKWLRSPGADEALALDVDARGHVWVAGSTTGDLFQPNAGGSDAFLVELDASGALVSSLTLGTPSPEAIHCVSAQGSNVAVGGFVNTGSVADEGKLFVSLYARNPG